MSLDVAEGEDCSLDSRWNDRSCDHLLILHTHTHITRINLFIQHPSATPRTPDGIPMVLRCRLRFNPNEGIYSRSMVVGWCGVSACVFAYFFRFLSSFIFCCSHFGMFGWVLPFFHRYMCVCVLFFSVACAMFALCGSSSVQSVGIFFVFDIYFFSVLFARCWASSVRGYLLYVMSLRSLLVLLWCVPCIE